MNPGDYPINATTVPAAGADGPVLYTLAGVAIVLAVAATAYVSVRAVRTIRRR